MGNEKIVKVNNLNKYYQDYHILRNLNLEISKGETISIIGRSGCGKTTFLRCLNCLELPNSGKLTIDNIVIEPNITPKQLVQESSEDLMSLARKHDYIESELKQQAFQIRNRVGMLFQNFNLFPHLNVLENVSISPIIVKKMNKADAIAHSKAVLSEVNMFKYAEHYPHQLSGGQSQRVAIARALAMEPKVMLYDEPTSALDPELVQEIIEIMNYLKSDGMTQVIVTHSFHLAKSVSERIIYMENGSFVEISNAETIFTNAKDERTKKYISLIRE